MLEGLIVAWVLTWFELDKVVLELLQPYTQVQLLTVHWYAFFVILGAICDIVKS